MKVVAFNGSPRKEGNTFQSLQIVMAELQKEGIETELIQVGGKALHGCTACYGCYKNKDRECVIKKDDLNSYVAKMIEADGIIIGSPVYFSNVTSEVKAFMDRAGLVARANVICWIKKWGLQCWP
jgi:multimeric flavodoxin WrbA